MKRSKSILTVLDLILTQDFNGLVKRVTGFTYQSTKKRFMKTNNYYDICEKKAVSYKWWTYFMEIEGQLIFNKYDYSKTTVGHQSDMRNLLLELGILNWVEISTERSLDKLDGVGVLNCLLEEKRVIEADLAKCVRATSGKKDRLTYKLDDVNYRIAQIKEAYNVEENTKEVEDEEEHYSRVSGDEVSSPTPAFKGLRLIK